MLQKTLKEFSHSVNKNYNNYVYCILYKKEIHFKMCSETSMH